MSGPADPRHFPTTHWSMILDAQGREDLRRQALEELARAYWRPLYVYVRRKGRSAPEAEDAVQGFYERLLRQDVLGRLDPGRGRFRAYLRMSMDRYLIHLHEREAAAKRGGGERPLSLDVEGLEARLREHPEGPEEAFDRAWALAVMERAREHLQAEFEAGERAGSSQVAMRFFAPDPPSYAEAAAEAGMSVAGFRSFLHRTRRRYRELVRREVAPTVTEGASVDAEVAALMEALRR